MHREKNSPFKKVLHDYIEGHPSRTITHLAKKARVAEMTVRRIVQGESEPSLETMMAILSVICSRKQQLEIIAEECPHLAQTFKYIKASDSQESTLTLNEHLRTFNGCKIINLAATREGTTREEIQYLTGKDGIDLLDRLLADNILEEISGKIYSTEREFSVLDSRTAIAQIKHFADMFENSHARANGPKALFISTEAINPAGVIEIKKLLKEMALKIEEIKRNPEYFGNIPFFVCGLMNSLND